MTRHLQLVSQEILVYSIGSIVVFFYLFSLAPLTLTAARERVVGMTKPFMQTGISILLRKDSASEESGLFDFLSPFSTETWVGLLIAYLLTACCFCVVCR